MKKTFVSLLALGPLSVAPLFAQQPSAINSLARARATFAAADANKDGRVSFEEFQKNKLGERREFDQQDPDKDGAFSLEEFTLFYRQMLVRAGERPGADLESEVTRVHAVRKARATEEATRKAAQRNAAKPAPKVEAPAPTPPTEKPAAELDLDAKLALALEALEKKAEARNATRADFNEVREMLVARAEAAKGAQGGAAEVDVIARFARVLDELEKKAMAGEYTRAEYQALRQSYVTRARNAVAKEPGQATQAEGIEARFDAALAELEQRALARNASREDFERVRQMLIARARHAAGANADSTAPNPELDALAQKLEAALTKLENRASEGNVTREEFQALRNMLIKRARNAALDADSKPGGPGEARVRASEGTKPAPPANTSGKDTPAPATKPPVREAQPVKPAPQTPPVSSPPQTPPKEEKPAGGGRPASKPPQRG